MLVGVGCICVLLLLVGLLLISSLYSYVFEMIRYNIGEQLKMQSHWNQQNLNITSSHILTNDKTRNIVGKKINKMHKTSHLQTYYHQPEPQNIKKNTDLQIKSTKKNQENNSKKSNQPRIQTQPKKTHKKKHPSIHRNSQTPQIFNNQRRLKTQGTLTEQDVPSIKKEHKKTHIKSISQGSKNMQTSKKQKIKPSKPSKDKHVKSCQIYGAWKKLDLPHHAISQTIHGVVNKKKRNNSSLVCNDKVVSRLLNASLLASEIGASPLVTSDRKTPHSSHSRTFKEYMSSIDLRIIRKIQDDVPIFLKKESSFQDTLRSLMRRNDISLEELTHKVTMIQRCWRNRQRKSIINTYKRLFQRATDNFFRQDKFVNDVSDIDIQMQKSDSNLDFQLFRNQNLASSLKKSQQPSNKNSLEEQEWSEGYKDGQDSFEKEEEGQGLNFGKYRQLVKEEIKSLNKKMGVQNHQKKGLDSKYLLQELMKHNFNKKWIEEQSSSLSDRQRKMQNKQQHVQSSQSQESELNQHTIQTYPKLSKNDEDDASFDDSQIYDRNKYAMNHLLQDGEQQSNLPKKLKVREQQKVQIKLKNKGQQPIDLQWINNQLHQDQIIVKNYLDCGLQTFSMQNQPSSVQSHSSDQAIGQRFQRANLAILRKKDNKNEVQPQLSNISSAQSEEIINNIVNLLLNQFAADISVILKKCNTALPERPKNPPPPRSNGIQTSYSSIKSYVQKVIVFVKQRDSVTNRIVENINKDIGPTSLEILSYLRPQPEDSQNMPLQSQSQENEDEDGLFVIPAQLFQQFQTHIESQYRKQQKKEMGPRIKAYLSFWNRCIFQSFNECLDYQRPFGVQGKPYDWLKQKKVFRPIQKQKVPLHLQRAQERLLQQTEIVAGVMFQNQNAIMGSQLSQEQMHMMNEERLSRILACELLQSQSSWINYNDEMAELLVQLSRIIQQKLFFEFSGSELKKLLRHRRILAEQSYIQQSVQFDLNELQ